MSTKYPDDWDVLPLGRVLTRPPRYGVNAPAVRRGTGVASYIRITDIDEFGRFRPAPLVGVSHPDAPNYRLARGQLVFARTGASVGKSYLYAPADGELIYAGFLINIEPNPYRLLPEFLAYFAQTKTYWDWVAKTSVRSGQPGINGREYATLPVPVPNLSEQREIVRILRDTDAAADALEAAIAKKEDVLRALLQQLLTGASRLPGFDAPWMTRRLGDHVSYLRTVPLSRAELDESSPIRCLHYGDIHTRASPRLDAVAESLPRAARHKVLRAGRLAVGDLVFADASEDPDGVGKSIELTAVPTEGLVAGLHTIAARFDKSVLADGFKAYLQFHPDFRKALLRLAAGTKVLATSRNYISSVELTLPTVDEQRSIAEVLQDAQGEIEALGAQLAKARDIKRGLAQQLLTGRIRLRQEQPEELAA